MCSFGGIQSYMWRLVEVLGRLRASSHIDVRCVSWNDRTEALVRHPSLPDSVAAWGAGRSKVRCVARSFASLTGVDVLIVGHVGLSPLASALQTFGRVRRWVLVLYGVEAWRRLGTLDRVAARRASWVVPISWYTAQRFTALNGVDPGRVRVIPPCVPEREPACAADFRLRGGFKILSVGRQWSSERHKGFEHVIEATARLAREHPDLHVNLVGDGDDRPRLAGLARSLGVSDRVTFWGSLPPEELDAAYADCDVFVLPSRKEGFGIVFLEAMRHGKPCIGGNHGGTPEVIEHGATGFLVEHGDVAALVECITTLKRDAALRHRMGVQARQAVGGRFGPERFYKEWTDLLMQELG
jgi:glycosyltransferase involved in cell wall biosynthesis